MSKEKDKKVKVKGSKKEFWFKIISFSIPFLILFLLELILRNFGYGEELKLFKEYPRDNKFYVINEKIGNKFFTNKEDVTVAKHDIFLKEKNKETYRIFILGASSSVGFPYKNATTFDLALKYQLAHLFPKKNIEVINLSLTAVCSFTLLDFAAEIPQYEPDLIVIYAGHNEYYGALGVGSSSTLGGNRFITKVLINARKLKVYQAISGLISNKKNENSRSKKLEDKQLMERMAAKKSIVYGSSIYKKGIDQYSRNMGEVCELFYKENIPVLFSTIVSNEKDLKPFSSLKKSNEVSANFQFEMANKAYNEREYKKAKEKYVRAKELDVLRFRAPLQINKIIKELSLNYDNVYLVDSKAEIENKIESKILGREVILEHVHPNLYGHKLISYALINEAKSNNLISPVWPSDQDISNVRKKLPYPKIDSIRGEYITMMMKEDWPFSEPIPKDYVFGKSKEEKIAFKLCNNNTNWQKTTNEIKSFYFKKGNFEELRKILEKQAIMYSYDRSMQMNAGGVNGQLGNNKKAIFYYQKAHQLLADSSSAHSLAISHLKNDSSEKSLYYFNYMKNKLKLEIGSEGVELITPILELQKELQKEEDNIKILIKIAEEYQKINLIDNAQKHFAKAKELKEQEKL